MKLPLLTLLLALLAGRGAGAGAATYYFAATGDDARTAAQAQNPASPWQTLAKLNASMGLLQPGDQVLFRRGDVFRGALVVTRSGSAGSPLTFGAYGPATDPAPVLSGGAALAGWVNVGPSLWEAPCAACGARVTGVYANGRALPLGRFPNPSAPNKGYLTITAHQNATQLTSAALTGSWTGGEAVIRSERWILDRAPITGQSGTTLTLTNTSGYGLKDRWGFFIQSHPGTLDLPGEWYYDPASHKIRLFAATAPVDGAVEATADAPAGVSIRNQQYLALENLTLARTLRFGLDAESISHATVRGVQVLGAGENGVRLNGGGTDVLFENNLVAGANNNGMTVSGYADFTLRNSTLRANGLQAGRGGSGDGQYFTLDVSSSNRVLLEGNTLDSCGYVGLSYYFSDNVTIQRNVVSNYCLTKDDGGGIYTWNGGNPPRANANAQILNNLVLHAVGAPEGTDSFDYVPGHGIYLDDCSQNVTVRGNTVAGCRSSGIFLHGNTRTTLSDNTCFDNGTQLLIAPAGACANTLLTVQNNVLVSADPDNLVANYDVPPTALAQLGAFGNNVYARPFDDLFKLRAGYRNYLLADWQAAFGFDAGSRDSPRRFRPYRVDARLGNNLVTNGQFATTTNDWYHYTSAGNGQIAWDNTNRLGAGGSLRLSFAGNSGQAGQILTTETRVGAIQQAKRYAVRFQAACASGSQVVEVYLKRGAGNYADLTPRTRVLLTPAATDYEVALVPGFDDPTVNVAFTVGEDANQEWLDNVDLREATLTAASRADSIRFEYNATASPRSVTLPAGARYVDARNAAYSGSLTLAPFTSVVLFRVNGPATPLPVGSAAFGNEASARLWPVPTAGPATLDLRALPAGEYTVTLFDATGRAVRQFTRAAGRVYALDLGALPAGVFLLRGQGVGGQFVQRVVRE